MRVQILVEAPYSDMRNDAVHRLPGEIHDCPDWYAKSIIASGLARPLDGVFDRPAQEEAAPPAVQAGEAVELGTQLDSEPEQAPSTVHFSNLPGITPALEKALYAAGITTVEVLLENLKDGKAINVLGPNKTARLKRHFGLIE